MGVDEVMTEIKQDALFYRNSNGGVTLSGGEPTFQADFAKDILKQCRKNGFYTCLDTCGYAKEEIFESILDEVDLVYFDLKHMDSHRHKELTGIDNSLILLNAKAVIRKGKSMTLRIPLIPTYNDSDENIHATGLFARELEVSEIHLLPYHRLGTNKFRALGKEYKLAHLDLYQKEEVVRIKTVLELMVHRDCKIEIV
jgi:pyruvate formate lyase activating enzyme